MDASKGPLSGWGGVFCFSWAALLVVLFVIIGQPKQIVRGESGPEVREQNLTVNASQVEGQKEVNLSSEGNYLRIPTVVVMAPTPFPPEQALDVTVSAYTRSVEEGTAWGITRSGAELAPGMVSVAVLKDKARTPVIKLGTKVYIEGLGYGIVADTGGGLCDTCIDWYIAGSRQDAFDFGIQHKRMWIIREVN